MVENEAERRLVTALVRPGGRTLELGGGFGRITSSLESVSGETVMIDFSWASLRRARGSLSRTSLVRSDIRMLPFREGVFDSVVAVRVLHHVKELEEVTGEVARVAREAGTVVFAVPNPAFARALRAGGKRVVVGRLNHLAYVRAPGEYSHPLLALEEVRGSGLFDNRLGRKLVAGAAGLSRLDVLTSRAWFLKPELFLRYYVRGGNQARSQRRR